jgi:predicted small integral membrane protein
VLLPPYESVEDFSGTGIYRAGDDALTLSEGWETRIVTAADIGADADVAYVMTDVPGAQLAFGFNGQEATVMYSVGPDRGIWAVLLNGEPLTVVDRDGKEMAVTIDAYSPTERYGLTETFSAPEPGQHTLTLVNTGTAHPDSAGTVMSIAQIEVLVPISQSSLPVILGAIIAVQLVGLGFAYVVGRHLFAGLASRMNTKRSILLALVIYSVIAMWGFVLNSVIEFWFLAWMVAIVQGGSQALSRSLYSVMSPASKSGEFFGLFGVMEKFASFIGPLLFALAVVMFGSSRPAILVLIVFFIVGGYLLTRVNVEEGRRVAQEEDAALMGGAAGT